MVYHFILYGRLSVDYFLIDQNIEFKPKNKIKYMICNAKIVIYAGSKVPASIVKYYACVLSTQIYYFSL